MYSSGNWGIEVFLAMSEEQAKRQDRVRCMSSELADSDDLYMKLDEIPEEMCVSKSLGWQKEICMTKSSFMELAREWNIRLFRSEIDFLKEVEGDNIWLIGFGG